MSWPNAKKEKLKVNYSFILSPVFLQLKQIVSTKFLGNPVDLSIRMGHGYAFSDHYARDWRSSNSIYGVAEQTGVHFINASMHLLGDINSSVVNFANFSSKGHSPDTSNIILTMENDVSVKIFNSYAIPYQFELLLTCTNGIYRYDGFEERIYTPRDYFDENSRYVLPPATYVNPISYRQNWNTGLENSLLSFLQFVIECNPFDMRDLYTAAASMDPLFKSKILRDGGLSK